MHDVRFGGHACKMRLAQLQRTSRTQFMVIEDLSKTIADNSIPKQLVVPQLQTTNLQDRRTE